MSDQIQFALGHAPWQPSMHSRLLEVFREYDRPLRGVIEQEGNYFMFECIAGELERTSYWLYFRLESFELQELRGLGGEAFDKVMANIFSSRPGRIAIAVEDAGIVADAELSSLKDIGSAVEILGEQFQRHLASLEASRSDVEELGASSRWDRMAAAV